MWFLALFFLCVAHVAINLWWLGADQHVIRTDEEMHMQFARDYYEVFAVNSYGNPIEALVDMARIAPRNPAHPPLLHILGGLTTSLVGYSMDGIALTSSVLFVLALLGCWMIARRFLTPRESFFTVFVVSMTPIMFAASRIFMTDYLSMVIVIWAIYTLIRTDGYRLTGWVFLFALLNGLGIMTRSITFLYYLLPAALVFALGVKRLVVWRDGLHFDRDGAGRLLLNAALTIVITIGVATPWYARHIDTVYDFWANDHAAGGGPLAIFDVGERGVEPGEGADPSAISQPSTVPPVALSRPGTATIPPIAAVSGPGDTLDAVSPAEKIPHPGVPWWRYAQDINNELLFMPLLALSLLGMLAGLCLRRFRTLPFFLLLAATLSSYVIMTVLFKYSTPRYLLQIAPALALFATLPILALPRGKIRAVVSCVLVAWLIFQFVNLTFVSLGPVARAGFQFEGKDVVVFKDILTPSYAFSRLSAPTEENYKNRMFEAMCQIEAQHAGVARGAFANYVVVGFRGLEFEQKHYWPSPNPFLRTDIPLALQPTRKFRQIALNRDELAPLEPYLGKADYVVYAARADDPAREKRWRMTLMSQGFMPMERFMQEGFGLVPARYYAVFAHQHVGETREIATTEDLDSLGAIDLYYLRRSANFSVLAPDLRAYADRRFRTLMASKYPGSGFPMTPEVSLLSANREPLGGNAHEFTLVFKVSAPMATAYRMYFHGVVEEAARVLLPADKREQGFMDWNFDPSPPTNEWPANDYIILRHTIQTDPMAYRIRFGFFEKATEQFYGNPAYLDWIDFSQPQ